LLYSQFLPVLCSNFTSNFCIFVFFYRIFSQFCLRFTMIIMIFDYFIRRFVKALCHLIFALPIRSLHSIKSTLRLPKFLLQLMLTPGLQQEQEQLLIVLMPTRMKRKCRRPEKVAFLHLTDLLDLFYCVFPRYSITTAWCPRVLLE
jgi:hypothetical protein